MRPLLKLPAQAALILLRAYQILISPLLGARCRFHPSCSSYAIEVVRRFGLLRGIPLTLARLGRCHPWHPGGLDPAPERLGAGWWRRLLSHE